MAPKSATAALAALATMALGLVVQATLNVPLSLYVGRSRRCGERQAALQAFWAVALAALTWWLWRRAAARVTAASGPGRGRAGLGASRARSG
jgi:ABC-type uncharacterized transport system permease subunit